MITTIAPCGMNCELCHSLQNRKKNCPGCRKKPTNCVIQNCQQRGVYCYDCSKFPCRRLKQLDLRYRTNYSMSMLENLVYIKEYGETAFLQQQRKKYTCPDCGKLRTVHYDYCIYCKQDKRSGKSGAGMKKTKE
ncbi:hypothetical protein IX307_001456 [Bacteroides pyogenes]|nr:hypothetical protein [Bacteroides pyogenes]MBR8724141.1 hypothetical protein [Bacteroides pyogenes]MBR8737999.1 hypothetical protein [Bacteroides pyogenes]MBR8753719.1 hypothetical protein [Bacteroides pyogenes]MBR8787132.1 hypothetical protein [Bacteroides pyogenes]